MQPKTLEGPEKQLKQMLITNFVKAVFSIEAYHEKMKSEKDIKICRHTPIFG